MYTYKSLESHILVVKSITLFNLASNTPNGEYLLYYQLLFSHIIFPQHTVIHM